MGKKLTGAQILVECLKLEGVEFIFGVPGGQTLSIMDALVDSPQIRFVATRHENAATHMADAYGRLTGRPGVALATTGPGVTNMVTGVGGALRDSSPAIIVTCNNRRRHIGTDDNQDADHVELLRQFTKHSRFVPDAEAVAYAVRDAFRIALTGNPGPVHVDFARDAVESEPVAFEPLRPEEYRAMARPCADDPSLQHALELLVEAERPVIWAGKGVLISEAGEAVMTLARALGLPVVTTYNGIGAVPAGDPLVFGPHSRNGTRLAREVLAGADCVLVAGNSLNAPSTGRWSLKLPRRLIQVDIDPEMIGRRYPVAAAVVGDVRDALERMRHRLEEADVARHASSRQAYLARMEEGRRAWTAWVHPPAHAEARPIKPQWLMHEAAGLIDDRTLVVADAGNPGIWTHLLPVRRPRGYMKPVGFGNMGFGLPAAIACKLARPHDRVLLFVGDGSLGMTLAELETAAREKAPMAIVVMNDQGYGNIKQEELHHYGPRYIGVDFSDARYAEVAKALGGDGERVEDPRQVGAAIQRALEAPVPYLLDVLIDPAENVWNDPI